MTEIAAHRGGAALWPENSEAAFRGALKLGVEQIEFDVQLSRDGVPVIFHDATLDRVTDGTGPLADRTLADLKKLSIFRGGGQIMTLEEGGRILAASDIVLRCEIKVGVDMVPYPGIVDKTLSVLSDLDVLGRTVITSFHLPTVMEVKAAVRPLRDVIWLLATPVVRLVPPQHIARIARDEGIDAVGLRFSDLSDEVLATLRAEGMRVGAFAVLEDAEIARALGQELSVFTTDRPDAAVRIRRNLAAA